MIAAVVAGGNLVQGQVRREAMGTGSAEGMNVGVGVGVGVRAGVSVPAWVRATGRGKGAVSKRYSQREVQ